MNLNKLLKLVGPKLNQEELDVFLGDIVFADQSYGEAQIELGKQRQVKDQLQKELEKLKYQFFMDKCGSPIDVRSKDSASDSTNKDPIVRDLQHLCSLHQAEKQALLLTGFNVPNSIGQRQDSNHKNIMQQISEEELTFRNLFPRLSHQNQGIMANEVNKSKVTNFRREKSEAIAQSVKSFSTFMSQLSSAVREQQNSMNEISKLMEKCMNCSPRLSELSSKSENILTQIRHEISSILITLQSCICKTEETELKGTIEYMMEELSTSIKLELGKIESGFKILFDVLKGTPSSKGSQDMIVRLCRDTNSSLHKDVVSLKHAVMKLRANLFHQNGDLLGENNHLYGSTQLFAESVSQCLDDLSSLTRELYDYRKETASEKEEDAINRLVENLHNQQIESLNLTAKLLTGISGDFSKTSDEFYLLNQRVLMYGEIIREMTNKAITKEALEQYKGHASMTQLRQAVRDSHKQEVPVSSPQPACRNSSIITENGLDPIMEVNSSDIVVATSPTSGTDCPDIHHQPAVISKSHESHVSAQSYEALMAVSSVGISVVGRNDGTRISSIDSSTSTEETMFNIGESETPFHTTSTDTGQNQNELSVESPGLLRLQGKEHGTQKILVNSAPHDETGKVGYERVDKAHRDSAEMVMRHLERDLHSLRRRSGDARKSSELHSVTNLLSYQLKSLRSSLEDQSYNGERRNVEITMIPGFTPAAKPDRPDLITLIARGSLGDH